MASQILAPFRTKHLWRRKNEGHERYNICATIADELETKLIFNQAHAVPQYRIEDWFDSLNVL